jgi:hypothetical protein
MSRIFAGGTTLAVALAIAITAFAQTPSPEPQQPQTTPSASSQKAGDTETVTLVGCIQSEADYRKAQNLGRGGAVGTGAGVGNEYVLVNASRSASAGGATGTAGSTSSAAQAYELSGTNESQAGQFVGKRVEIVGKLKRAEMGATGPTGGATAGAPPRGVDATSKDLKLRELEVTSVRESTGTCPTAG